MSNLTFNDWQEFEELTHGQRQWSSPVYPHQQPQHYYQQSGQATQATVNCLTPACNARRVDLQRLYSSQAELARQAGVKADREIKRLRKLLKSYKVTK